MEAPTPTACLRILGMGDVFVVIEDVQKSVNIEEAKKLARKVKTAKF